MAVPAESGHDEWMTAREAAAYLRMSKAKFGQLLATGKLPTRPSLRDGRVKLVRRSDLDRIAASEPQGGHRS